MVQHSRDLFAKNQAELVPVALKEWGNWYGPDAVKKETRALEERASGEAWPPRRATITKVALKWEIFRGVNGLSPYLDPSDGKFAAEEDSILSYVALSVGPMGKEVSTMITHLSAIWY